MKNNLGDEYRDCARSEPCLFVLSCQRLGRLHGVSLMFLKANVRQVKVQLRCEIVVFACLIAKVRL